MLCLFYIYDAKVRKFPDVCKKISEYFYRKSKFFEPLTYSLTTYSLLTFIFWKILILNFTLYMIYI